MTVNRYLPEGSLYGTAENREALASQAMLERGGERKNTRGNGGAM